MCKGLDSSRIPVSGPWITQKEVDYVTDAVTNAWYADANVYHERFEKAFSKYLGIRFAIALPSCTSAIHLALLALGVGLGDEVIVPEITWIASAAPASYVGATPVFADIDPDTWCISVESFERCITPKTRAVIPVDLYGNIPQMDRLLDVARHYGIPVVEDAAQAVGTEFHARRAGSFGDVGVFSFHGSKTLTTGEGGMLVTDSEKVRDRVLFLRDHGRQPGGKMFWNSEIAYKYKMSNMQAALGLAQLERVDELIARKRQIFSWYREFLSDMDGLTLNAEIPGTLNTYWMVTVVVDSERGVEKEHLIEMMKTDQIDCRPFFYPLSSLPAFERHSQHARERNSVSYRLSPYGVNLPSGLQMTQEKVDRVCATLKAAIHKVAVIGSRP